MAINTVLGPIDADELGKTSMHEHLLMDARVWLRPSREEPPADLKVTMENLGFIRWNYLSLADNLVSDDAALLVRELESIRGLGGSGIVELTCIGMGRRVGDLPDIARSTGLHIVVGCGFYIHDSHPPWVDDASVEALTDLLVGELEDGIDDTGIRAGLIGEIGTSDPVTSREVKVLSAAAAAATRTGAAVNVHLDPRGKHALHVLDVLTAETLSPERVIFSHMDQVPDRGYQKAVAETGAVLSYDSFGHEFYLHDSLFRQPRDLDRCDYVEFMLGEGFGKQIVLGCDVCTKVTLKTYGGMGHEHLLKRIVPTLIRVYGVEPEAIDDMLVHTPRRLLDRPEEKKPTAA